MGQISPDTKDQGRTKSVRGEVCKKEGERERGREREGEREREEEERAGRM